MVKDGITLNDNFLLLRFTTSNGVVLIVTLSHFSKKDMPFSLKRAGV